MTDSDDPRDPLLDELRDLFATADPVPPLVSETAKASLGWRRLDADLAELLADSSLDQGAPAGVRGAGAALRSVSFGAGRLTIDIEIRGGEGELKMLGQLSPATRTAIEIQTADGAAPTVTRSDELGRFRAQLSVGSSTRLRVATGDPGSLSWIETSWISV